MVGSMENQCYYCGEVCEPAGYLTLSLRREPICGNCKAKTELRRSAKAREDERQ
jgi:hypothetical protein